MSFIGSLLWIEAIVKVWQLVPHSHKGYSLSEQTSIWVEENERNDIERRRELSLEEKNEER